MQLRTYVAFAALILAACKDDKPSGAAGDTPGAGAPGAAASRKPPPDEQRALDDMISRRAREDKQKLADKLASKSARLSDCVVIVYLEDLERIDPALAKELQRTCRYDVPLAVVEAGVAAAESAREAKPDAITLPECDVHVGLAIEDLEKHGTADDRAKELIARFDKACPLIAKTRADRALRNAATPGAGD
jgi:hypothetical protein